MLGKHLIRCTKEYEYLVGSNNSSRYDFFIMQRKEREGEIECDGDLIDQL